MAEIITFSDSLKRVSELATVEEAPEIIKKLEETLAKHDNGIGLSAIQIGIPKRIFVIAVAGANNSTERYEHFINPEVVECNNQFTFSGEGCLSYPGIYLDTQRYRDFTLKRGIIDGGEYREEIDYFYYNPEEDDRNSNIISIAVQHEFQHMLGEVLPDYGVEYVNKPIEREEPKIGRNDPCPCGKKRPDGAPIKYKKCCLKN